MGDGEILSDGEIMGDGEILSDATQKQIYMPHTLSTHTTRPQNYTDCSTHPPTFQYPQY